MTHTRHPHRRAQRRRNDQDARGGFTMLELIIATALMGVLALTLYASLRVAYRARDTAATTVGPARSAEIAVGMIRRDLENALPPKGILAGPFIGQLGLGAANASEVEFYAVAPPSPELLAGDGGGSGGGRNRSGTSGTSGMSGSRGRSGSSSSKSGGLGTSGGLGGGDPTTYGGVQRVGLLALPAEDGSGGTVLVRRVLRNLLATTEPPPEDEVLCRHVSEFTIRYFDGSQWLHEWDSAQLNNALPMAVEVSLAVTAPPDSPAARAALASGATAPAYRATRTFFLPCRDDAALTQGATQ